MIWIDLFLINLHYLFVIYLDYIKKHVKGNTQFIKNTTFRLSEKMIAQPWKMFCKILMNTPATISIILLS